MNVKEKIDYWSVPLTIARNRFVYKSLSCWSCNVGVGCEHACTFCYVPEVSTRKLSAKLEEHGVSDPDAEWGEYFLVRPWDEKAFRSSLRKAEAELDLNKDGNRAVMFCTTTDPYQVIRHPNIERRKELANALKLSVRAALRMILEESTLNVRILTRSPLARQDFDLFKEFGRRLLFGMSLPTLRNDLSKVYEPNAPSPTARLKTLVAAREMGINVFVAMAPTYPECDGVDLSETLNAVAALKPVTIFHEPINIRADNVGRIQRNAASEGVELKTEVFKDSRSWVMYAYGQLLEVEAICKRHGIQGLHLWPDQSLGNRIAIEHIGHVETSPMVVVEPQVWLNKWWNRISEWP